jgi:hypothetical protein
MKKQVVFALNTFKTASIFGTKYAVDFPATSIAGQQFAKIAAAVPKTSDLAALQVSGASDAHVGALSKATLRLLIHDDLSHINQAAHTLALLGTAGVDGKFRMTHSKGDQSLINNGRAFITEATPFKTQMIQLGLAADFLDTLKTHTDGFETAAKTKATGKQSQAGATAGMSDTAHNAAIALHIVDTIVRNTYKNDPQKLAEWTVASHVERVAKKAKVKAV